MHLNFQEYVTDNIVFWYISNKIVFYLLLYICPHKFLSSTMMNINKLCLFNLNITFFCLAIYRDKIDRNFQHSKIDYILSKNKWDSRGHASFTAWIPLVLHAACHISAAISICLRYFFPIPVHLFSFQLSRDCAAMQHLFIICYH